MTNTAGFKLDSSMLSFPSRGPYGNPAYAGNTSGYVILSLLRHFRPQLYCDPTEGGGTSADCVRQLQHEGIEITYCGLDLRHGYDIVSESLLSKLPRPADFVFFHPPYHDIVAYSSHVWGDKPHPSDLSRCASYEEYLAKMFIAMQNIHEAVRRGGRYCIQIGDMRRAGVYYAIQADLLKLAPGKLDGIIIKEQHNCTSASRRYPKPIVRINHEYLLIFERTGLVAGMLDCAFQTSQNLKALANLTWQAVVESALRRLGGEARVEEIYRAIEGNPKTERRPNWQARVRATLQEGSQFQNLAHGVWALRGLGTTQPSGGARRRAA
ncbi:MAG TPA: hypothetical protein VJZ91_02400 [Blastocatellia bacterium]|nr:hypothetical protein [Blastocatellia bacterium]